jgi:hypothetical protein
MKVRADVAALIRRGHTDSYIASQTGYHRTTVARARRLLGSRPDRSSATSTPKPCLPAGSATTGPTAPCRPHQPSRPPTGLVSSPR